jgi:small subunit ribosomal protein S20
MANTSSAKKAARKMLRRTEINKSLVAAQRLRARWEALASGDKAPPRALAAAEPILCARRRRGVIHKRSASRKFRALQRGPGAGLNAVWRAAGEIGLVLARLSQPARQEKNGRAEATRIQQVVHAQVTLQVRRDGLRLDVRKAKIHINVAQDSRCSRRGRIARVAYRIQPWTQYILPNFRPPQGLFSTPAVQTCASSRAKIHPRLSRLPGLQD